MEKNFGEFIRRLRAEKNLTQKELAGLLYVSESAVSKWEKNVARPDISLLPKLSELLGVTEHELITASIDNRAREEKVQARRWRAVSLSWSLFFYISYGVALLTCFICNLAVEHTLSWFWIVASALLLAFTCTNLPGLIKKNRLLFVPLSMYTALALLLGVCCLYTAGNWFWVAAASVLFGLAVLFTPIYIAKYAVFERVRKYNDFLSLLVDFLGLNGLLLLINGYTLAAGYASRWWYCSIALPIVAGIYLSLNLLLSIRFLKTNRFVKTGLVLLLTDVFLYLPPLFLKLNDPALQKELNDANVLRADLLSWEIGVTLENNVHLLICLTLLLLSAAFCTVGMVRRRGVKN